MKPADMMHEPPYSLKDFVDDTRRHGLGSALMEGWYMTKERTVQSLEECLVDLAAKLISLAYSPVFNR